MTPSDTTAGCRRANVRRRATAGLALATIAPAVVAVTLGVGVATAPAAHAAPAGCTTENLVTTCTFDYTGAKQDWVVPLGVTKAAFTVVGAAGGNAGGRPGGQGGGSTSTMAVTPGTAYQLFVGGKGGNDTDTVNPGLGGWNGGANGAGISTPNGGGGGGASDIRTAPYGIDSRVLVAGGGGGAGSAITYGNAPHGIPGAGGNGSGIQDGRQGENVSGAWVGAGGGGGATTSLPGRRGGPSAPGNFLYNGCGFWDPAYATPGEIGGLGHSPNLGRGGAGGYLFSALSGGRCDQFRGWGGGGGGGWFGGGGGGGGITGGAGGGGGSGHAHGLASNFLGMEGAHGVITITYTTDGEWTAVPGTSTMTSAPTVARRPTAPGQPDQHDVFYLNANSQVIQRLVTDGVASPEYNLGAVLYPGSTVAAAWRPDGKRLDLFGRGTESALWQKTFTVAGGWTGWEPRTPPGVVNSDPSAAAVSPSRVDAFYRDPWAGSLNRLMFVDGEQPHRNTFAQAVGLRTGPAAVDTGDDTRVFYGERVWDPPGAFTRLSLPDAGGTFTFRALPAQPTTSSPAAARVGDRVVVAARSDGARLAVTLDGSQPSRAWTEIDAPSPAGSAPALVASPSGDVVVYLRGNDNRLIARGLAIG